MTEGQSLSVWTALARSVADYEHKLGDADRAIRSAERALRRHHEQHSSKAPPPTTQLDPEPTYQPLCAVDWKRSACLRAGIPQPCHPAGHVGATPGTTGAWTLTDDYVYFLDRGLVRGVAALVGPSASIVEFGAGKGCMASALRREGVLVRAYDGSPNASKVTRGLVHTADLTRKLKLASADWVLCLEVAEHVPRRYENILLANLDRAARKGVILSWSNSDKGNGHVNARDNDWVLNAMRTRGFVWDRAAQVALRGSVSDIHWYRESVMVFKRNAMSQLIAAEHLRGPVAT